MLPHNDCDKLSKSELKLFRIIKILQNQSCCDKNIILISKKSSKNSKHKNTIKLNDLSVKTNLKEKMNTECIFPIEKSDKICNPSILEMNVEDDTKYIPFIQEINIEYDTNCKKKNTHNKEKINNNTTANAKKTEKHIFLVDSKVIPMYENNDIPPFKTK